MFRSLLLSFLAVAGLSLTGCSTMNSQASADPHPAPTEDKMLRDVAQAGGVCIFELDESVARRNGIYYRKEISFSRGEGKVALARLNPFYRQIVAQYMTIYNSLSRNTSLTNPNDPRLFEDWLDSDGGYIQRIVWGKGQGRKTFVNVSHYPGDNHYGIIFQIGPGGQGTPVLNINDGDFYDCKVFAPLRSR